MTLDQFRSELICRLNHTYRYRGGYEVTDKTVNNKFYSDIETFNVDDVYEIIDRISDGVDETDFLPDDQKASYIRHLKYDNVKYNNVEYKNKSEDDNSCLLCDYSSDKNVIFVDTLTDEYYYYHRTREFDKVDNDWVYEKIYISYCPWCGRKL